MIWTITYFNTVDHSMAVKFLVITIDFDGPTYFSLKCFNFTRSTLPSLSLWLIAPKLKEKLNLDSYLSFYFTFIPYHVDSELALQLSSPYYLALLRVTFLKPSPLVKLTLSLEAGSSWVALVCFLFVSSGI